MTTLAVSLNFLTAIDYWIGVGILAATYTIFTLGLQLNVGYTGIINFGQVGFMAIGAYAAIILVVDVGIPFLIALVLAILITMAAGMIIGIPSLRLRADYFAIATIAFSEIMRYTARNARELTGGNQGTIRLEIDEGRIFADSWFTASNWISDTLLGPIGLGGGDFRRLPLFLVVWLTVAILVFGLSRLLASPWGRVLRAIREDEDAARALGKNVLSYKLQSLAISSALGAVAGIFLVFNLESVNQSNFVPLITFIGYAILVLGGLASFTGVIVGSVVLWTLLEGLRFMDLPLAADKEAALRFMIVGLILILVMAFRPQGVLGKREEMVLSD